MIPDCIEYDATTFLCAKCNTIADATKVWNENFDKN